MEKKQNFAGFSEGNSREKSQNSRNNQPISQEKSQNSQKNRPISRDFSGKKILFSNDFQGQIVRKIEQFRRKSREESCQETISKKQPVSLNFFGQISLKSINFASI